MRSWLHLCRLPAFLRSHEGNCRFELRTRAGTPQQVPLPRTPSPGGCSSIFALVFSFFTWILSPNRHSYSSSSLTRWHRRVLRPSRDHDVASARRRDLLRFHTTTYSLIRKTSGQQEFNLSFRQYRAPIAALNCDFGYSSAIFPNSVVSCMQNAMPMSRTTEIICLLANAKA